MLENLLWWGVTAFYIAGWLMWFRERHKYQDALTDLCQVMHDHDLDRDDLRRTEDTKRFGTTGIRPLYSPL